MLENSMALLYKTKEATANSKVKECKEAMG
jgi:hypothetical protein